MSEAEEILSEQIHKNYCQYVLVRTGKPYWTGGDYSKLDEETKEADRIQARWMLQAIRQAKLNMRDECVRVVKESRKGCTVNNSCHSYDIDALASIDPEKVGR